MARKLRRIITGHNEKGKSIVAYDGPPGGIGEMEMWVTERSPADNKHKNIDVKRKPRLEPPPNGSKFGFFQLPPEDPSISVETMEKEWAAGFAAIDSTHCRPDTTRDPRMHTTKTVDYIIVLEGEITLLLDEDEVDLKPFDVVIQRGTNHAWINKGSTPALLAAILIDAEPL
ncbi:MAG: cupin domain-containing protein [Promethearchaeota archaeon]|jgi:mannose-6-phosphate isomerase-like protein (cupin superfamily)